MFATTNQGRKSKNLAHCHTFLSCSSIVACPARVKKCCRCNSRQQHHIFVSTFKILIWPNSSVGRALNWRSKDLGSWPRTFSWKPIWFISYYLTYFTLEKQCFNESVQLHFCLQIFTIDLPIYSMIFLSIPSHFTNFENSNHSLRELFPIGEYCTHSFFFFQKREDDITTCFSVLFSQEFCPLCPCLSSTISFPQESCPLCPCRSSAISFPRNPAHCVPVCPQLSLFPRILPIVS